MIPHFDSFHDPKPIPDLNPVSHHVPPLSRIPDLNSDHENNFVAPPHRDRLVSVWCKGETLLGAGADIDFYNWENFQSVNYLNFNPLQTKTVQNQGRI